MLLFTVALPFCNPTNSMQGSYFSTSLPILVILLFLIVAGPSEYEVVSHSFDLHFPDNSYCQTLFYVLSYFYTFFRKTSIQALHLLFESGCCFDVESVSTFLINE